MGFLAKTPAVLSLNGHPQVTLHVEKDGEVNETQHADPPTSVGEPTLELMKLLGSLVRLRISDGRVIVGRFHCFDKHQNVVLKDAREFAPTRTGLSKNSKNSKSKAVPAAEAEARDQKEETRFAGLLLPSNSRSLGLTLVPGKHIVYMKVHC
uniref:Sm domain-containing protein n=1 Tax=Hyaloperonospora arabidopsidis (strain Emoy2) TaxID=559515 RepID=M4BRI2_HYAAE